MKHRFIKDSYEADFSNEQEFMEELKEMESEGKWESHKTHELGVDYSLGPLFVDEVQRRTRFGIEEEIVRDTLEPAGSGLFLDTPTGLVPLRSFAVRQLIGTALAIYDEKQNEDEKRDPGFFKDIFTAAKDHDARKNRDNQVWVCNGKVTAVGSNEYCIMPIDQLFEQTVATLRSTFHDLAFMDGFNSLEYTRANYAIGGNDAEVLRKKYESVMKQGSRPIPGMAFTVKIQTSNAKNSAATITPIITSSTGARIPIGSCIRVDHKHKPGREGIDLLTDLASGVYAKFGDVNTKITAMSETVINRPRDCLINLCKKAGLRNKLIGECADNLSLFLDGCDPNRGCTMFDIYVSICEMTVYAEAAGFSDRDIHEIEEGIARIANYRWKELDKPIDT